MIDLESEMEAWLLALPYGHYQRVMRNVDDYLVTGGIPDGQLIILLTFFRKTRDGTQRADVDRAVRAMNICRTEHDRTITHDFERSE